MADIFRGPLTIRGQTPPGVASTLQLGSLLLTAFAAQAGPMPVGHASFLPVPAHRPAVVVQAPLNLTVWLPGPVPVGDVSLTPAPFPRAAVTYYQPVSNTLVLTAVGLDPFIPEVHHYTQTKPVNPVFSPPRGMDPNGVAGVLPFKPTQIEAAQRKAIGSDTNAPNLLTSTLVPVAGTAPFKPVGFESVQRRPIAPIFTPERGMDPGAPIVPGVAPFTPTLFVTEFRRAIGSDTTTRNLLTSTLDLPQIATAQVEWPPTPQRPSVQSDVLVNTALLRAVFPPPVRPPLFEPPQRPLNVLQEGTKGASQAFLNTVPPAPAKPPPFDVAQRPLNVNADTSRGTSQAFLNTVYAKPFAQTDWPAPIEYRKSFEPSWPWPLPPDLIPPFIDVPVAPAVGGYDGKAKRKYTVRVGDKLLVFNSEAEAANALVVSQPEKAEAAIAIPQVKALAKATGNTKAVNAALKAKQYDEVVALHAQMQDEADVEFLLQHADRPAIEAFIKRFKR